MQQSDSEQHEQHRDSYFLMFVVGMLSYFLIVVLASLCFGCGLLVGRRTSTTSGTTSSHGAQQQQSVLNVRVPTHIYVTKTGAKFHSKFCEHVKHRRDARELTPCDDCDLLMKHPEQKSD